MTDKSDKHSKLSDQKHDIFGATLEKNDKHQNDRLDAQIPILKKSVWETDFKGGGEKKN